MKMALIGEQDMVFPFKAFGIEVFPVDNVEEGEKIIRKLLGENDYAFLFVSEGIYPGLKDIVNEVRKIPYPGIIPVPGVKGRTNISIENLREIIRKAIGIDIGG